MNTRDELLKRLDNALEYLLQGSVFFKTKYEQSEIKLLTDFKAYLEEDDKGVDWEAVAKIISAFYGLKGCVEALTVGAVITQDYVDRINNYYIANLMKFLPEQAQPESEDKNGK